LAQYLLSTCSRRRFAKEDELRRIMGHRVKAEVRETYMENVEKLLKDTLGIKVNFYLGFLLSLDTPFGPKGCRLLFSTDFKREKNRNV
jgi:hypothetical protein